MTESEAPSIHLTDEAVMVRLNQPSIPKEMPRRRTLRYRCLILISLFCKRCLLILLDADKNIGSTDQVRPKLTRAM
jgi:hypothetical protein